MCGGRGALPHWQPCLFACQLLCVVTAPFVCGHCPVEVFEGVVSRRLLVHSTVHVQAFLLCFTAPSRPSPAECVQALLFVTGWSLRTLVVCDGGLAARGQPVGRVHSRRGPLYSHTCRVRIPVHRGLCPYT